MSQQPISRARQPLLIAKRHQNVENVVNAPQPVTYVKDAMSSVLPSRARTAAAAPVPISRKRVLGEKTNTVDKENANSNNALKNTAPTASRPRAPVVVVKKEPVQASFPAPTAAQPPTRRILQELKQEYHKQELKQEEYIRQDIKRECIKQENDEGVMNAIKTENASFMTYRVQKRTLDAVKTRTVEEQKALEEKAREHEAQEDIKRRKRDVMKGDDSFFWDDLDADDAHDPLMVSEYVVEIFDYMQELEIATMPDPNYMVTQKELAWKMRGVLVDWLAEVHNKFKLLPETLFLSVNLIDRFLSLRTVSLVKLQLVGVTALFIAAKYEEVMAPSVQNFIYMSDGGFSDHEILQAERYMLQALGFQLCYPSPMNFLRRISKADNYDIHSRTVAKYLMEIPLLDHSFLECPPSMISGAALCLARRMMGHFDWDNNLIHYSGYTLEELMPCMERMIHYLQKPVKVETFIFRKYATKRFMKASIFVREWVIQLAQEQAAAAAAVDAERNAAAQHRMR
ncbi:G2/mitotic-specific cyclin [Mortierella sp. GBA30]|nr:G2/mitotic-specific cyclin [Mortierella sp. GBA30]